MTIFWQEPYIAAFIGTREGSVLSIQRLWVLGRLLPLFALFSMPGCAHRQLGIVGKWLQPIGSNAKSGVVYEFHSDGTMSHYSQIDLNGQPADGGVMISPKFNGIFTFRAGELIYHTTSIETDGKLESMSGVKEPDQKFRAVVGAHTLTLTAERMHGQSEEYDRQ